ncbi:MAG: methylated-DNA--[protein]-cysteine S-methyltransferase [Acidaminococcaceae bacterium]|nr:methylated-DNA--[protein]-cysteine S-methyltransferase [Acidaminococcaceae bacterium]
MTETEDAGRKNALELMKRALNWFDLYFSGKKPDPRVLPLAPRGSEFRQMVWQELLEIPYGKTTTYGAIAGNVARKLHKEKMSAQAVGGAVGHNPVAIIIPCHRVVGSNGSLTGYAGGLDIKYKLLRHEGADMDSFFLPK